MRILGTMGSWLQKVLYSGPHQNGALALFHLAVLTTTLLCFLILMGGTYDSSVCWPPEGFQFCHMQVNTGLCPSLGNAFPVPLQHSTCLSLKVRAGAQRGFLSPDDLSSLPTSKLIHPPTAHSFLLSTYHYLIVHIQAFTYNVYIVFIWQGLCLPSHCLPASQINRCLIVQISA